MDNKIEDDWDSIVIENRRFDLAPLFTIVENVKECEHTQRMYDMNEILPRTSGQLPYNEIFATASETILVRQQYLLSINNDSENLQDIKSQDYEYVLTTTIDVINKVLTALIKKRSELIGNDKSSTFLDEWTDLQDRYSQLQRTRKRYIAWGNPTHPTIKNERKMFVRTLRHFLKNIVSFLQQLDIYNIILLEKRWEWLRDKFIDYNSYLTTPVTFTRELPTAKFRQLLDISNSIWKVFD